MNVREILAGIPKLRVLVVGDICLDRWCTYNPAEAEPSRETGIPRIAVTRTEVTPGAGGTIANNLAALGAGTVAVLGAIGVDGFGWELTEALRVRGVRDELLVRTPEIATFTYTKLLNAATGEEDRPRVDFINVAELSAAVEGELERRLAAEFADFDAVLVIDQAETAAGGVVTARLRDRIAALAAEHPRIVTWVDSRERPEHFRNVTLKPNRDEFEAACRRRFGRADAHRLVAENNLRGLVITHGPDGAQVVTPDGEAWAAGRRVQAVDICGAGDSFSAGAACALALTGSLVDAAEFGNLVASVTVTKKGTGTASPEELLAI